MDAFKNLDNAALLEQLKALAQRERGITVEFLGCLAEVDRRRAAVEEGFGSLFNHCVEVLRLSRGAAFVRIRAARAANRYPELYPLIRDGEIHVTNLSLAYEHVLKDRTLIQSLRGKTRLEVERLVAALSPKPDSPDRIRVLSAPPVAIANGPQAEVGAPESMPKTGRVGAEPLQPENPALGGSPSGPTPPAAMPGEIRLEFKFTAGEALLDAIGKLRALLWHRFPEGRLEDLFLAAAREFIVRRDPARARRGTGPRAATSPDAVLPASQTRRPSRRVPSSVARDVALRDGGTCAFVSGSGRRCGEARSLEFDHVKPWALGGSSRDAANIRLLCRAHNQWTAMKRFGAAAGRRVQKDAKPSG